MMRGEYNEAAAICGRNAKEEPGVHKTRDWDDANTWVCEFQEVC